jgi:hypothetical protein
MTPENSNEPMMMKDAPADAWDAAAALGIDMSLIEYNLSLTPDERIYQHQCALGTVLMLEAAGKELHGSTG